MKKKLIIILALLAVALGAAVALGVFRGKTPVSPGGTICTMDAKLCPDGSYVGRHGPKCEFDICPIK